MFRYVRHLYSSLFILQQIPTNAYLYCKYYLYSSLFILQLEKCERGLMNDSIYILVYLYYNCKLYNRNMG